MVSGNETEIIISFGVNNNIGDKDNVKLPRILFPSSCEKFSVLGYTFGNN